MCQWRQEGSGASSEKSRSVLREAVGNKGGQVGWSLGRVRTG